MTNLEEKIGQLKPAQLRPSKLIFIVRDTGSTRGSVAMTILEVFSKPQWPYDEALTWMAEGSLYVRKTPNAFLLGCGSHKETVITLGRDPAKQNFFPEQSGLSVVIRKLDRGGGMTAHEPGQLVLYPIFNIDHQQLSVPLVIEILEEATISFLRELGLDARRSNIGPGIFIDEEKVGFIGLRIKERIVSHGLAINLLNDAAIFKAFAPCGIKSLKVTSAKHHVNLLRPQEFYQERLVHHFLQVLADRTKMGTRFDVGVLLSSATDSSGTNTLASGK